MSDDLPPVDGHVLPEDARRLAEGRTLVNLDAVDFSPIRAALESLTATARRLADWQVGGMIGAAGHELLFQLAERWKGLESALAAAGLTENAAWRFDHEKENAEQRKAAAFMLRDMLLDVRKGKYGPQGKFGHDTLAKRLALAVEVVQGLTATLPALDPKRFRRGRDYADCTWNGKRYIFAPAQRACVKELWEGFEYGTPEVGQSYILEKAGLDSPRLQDVFKGNDAWKTMIVKGTAKDTFRLADPT